MELSIDAFWSALWAWVQIYFYDLVDPALKTSDVPQNQLLPTYDFIIVGAGGAGCVVGRRLSENPAWNILLIEAGGDEAARSETPLLEYSNRETEKDWNYTTVRQKRACLSTGGICLFPRGRVMGGSTALNGMMYVRGGRRDYDIWEELGNKGWNYKSMLYYFIKSENNTEPYLNRSKYRGTKGPFNVQYPLFKTKLYNEYVIAAEEFGFKHRDYNIEYKDSVDNIQYAIEGPMRESTDSAFLNPVRHRRNLSVIKKSQVIKVILDARRKRAIGVEYIRNNKIYRINAKKEVILCAGAIDTPKLLMLSGIGPREDLEKHGIEVVADLPVGKNLQDHVLLSLNFLINKKLTITSDVWKTNKSIIAFTKHRRGPLTTTGGEAMAFLNSLDRKGIPNFQMMWYSYYPEFNVPQHTQLIHVNNILLDPKSVGYVTIRSNDWRDPPVIQPNYLTHQYDYDVIYKGLKLVFEYMKTPTMMKYSPVLYKDKQPICKDRINLNDYIKCLIDYYSQTVYHPVATARMGPADDPGAVVSPELMVRGFENLRVIDASVMPVLPRANTMAPTIAVGEKGSDIVKKCYSFGK